MKKYTSIQFEIQNAKKIPKSKYLLETTSGNEKRPDKLTPPLLIRLDVQCLEVLIA
jgi:hypothetical protein